MIVSASCQMLELESILSAYELKLWDLKEDTEYQIPEGKKVKVLIPLPENADCYSDLAIAHYSGK